MIDHWNLDAFGYLSSSILDNFFHAGFSVSFINFRPSLSSTFLSVNLKRHFSFQRNLRDRQKTYSSHLNNTEFLEGERSGNISGKSLKQQICPSLCLRFCSMEKFWIILLDLNESEVWGELCFWFLPKSTLFRNPISTSYISSSNSTP